MRIVACVVRLHSGHVHVYVSLLIRYDGAECHKCPASLPPGMQVSVVNSYEAAHDSVLVMEESSVDLPARKSKEE